MPAGHDPEDILAIAVDAFSSGRGSRSTLDGLSVPVYATDAAGSLTYWNEACAEFAGREPDAGEDRWCVTWHLYTTAGEPLPPDRCPMAQALKEKRPIRETIAIAERPDGSRRAFKPYPTPLFDSEGALTGAVNILIDVTEEQCAALHHQAEHCRRLAEATYDQNTSKMLGDMADGFDRTADALAEKRGSKAAPAKP
ncbi:MAG TPA: PAS domain-containing protein [Sphingomicrobium sp.]